MSSFDRETIQRGTHSVVCLGEVPSELSTRKVAPEDFKRHLIRRGSAFEGERVGETTRGLGEAEPEIVAVRGGGGGVTVPVGVVR